MRNLPVLTSLDESYHHRAVAPYATALGGDVQTTQYVDPAWAERCYHLLVVDEQLMINIGRSVNVHAGLRAGFVGAADDDSLHALRLAEPFSATDDSDDPAVGGLAIEVVRPLEEIHLTLDQPGFAVGFDLTYRARSPPVATAPNRIESKSGEVVTDYLNFFQSGTYSGTVTVAGQTRTVTDRLGFRDRGWGLRKHEGAPRRGLVVGCFCEFADEAIYLLLYETASGKRVFTNGWAIGPDGAHDTVVAADHTLRLERMVVRSGRIEVTFASGARRMVEFDVHNYLFLSAVGYTADPDARTPGHERHDLTDGAVITRLRGQTDHACRFRLDGREGYGYLETGIGVHARYRRGVTPT